MSTWSMLSCIEDLGLNDQHSYFAEGSRFCRVVPYRWWEVGLGPERLISTIGCLQIDQHSTVYMFVATSITSSTENGRWLYSLGFRGPMHLPCCGLECLYMLFHARALEILHLLFGDAQVSRAYMLVVISIFRSNESSRRSWILGRAGSSHLLWVCLQMIIGIIESHMFSTALEHQKRCDFILILMMWRTRYELM